MALKDAAPPALRTEDSAVRMAAEPAPRGLKRKYTKKTHTLADGDFSGDTIEYFVEEVILGAGTAAVGTVDTELPAAAALADATANPTIPSIGAELMVFNGTTWDRARSGAGVIGTGVLRTVDGNANTATLANVADSATSVTLQAANVARIGWTCANDSTEALFIKFGATASATSFTVKVAAAGYYEMPRPIYTGIIDGIWTADAAGSARLTELT